MSHEHVDEEEDLKKTTQNLFKIFDKDGSGSVTAKEFEEEMKSLNAGLTLDEIVGLIHDFDTDGDGEISLVI